MKVVNVFVLCCALLGCVNENWTSTVSSSSLRIDKVTSMKWIPGNGDAVGAKIEIEYERPIDVDLASFVDSHIAKSYTDARGVVVADSGIKHVQCTFKNEYDDSGKMDDWQLRVSGQFVWFNGIFATYRTMVFTYFGGVHPKVWYGNATYNRRTRRRITLADMFDETNIVSVVNIIRRKIATDESRSDCLRRMCSGDVSGVAADYIGECDGGEPKVTENFMIVEQGIVWTYNEYEISSYDDGTTDVFVPWNEIAKYLKDGAPMPVMLPSGGWDAMLEDAQKNDEFERIGNLIFFYNIE